MGGLGIGISEAAALLWQNDPTYGSSYDEYFMFDEDGYYFFSELPDWAYDPSVGPFFIDDEGAIWSISTRPSQEGILIGNLV